MSKAQSALIHTLLAQWQQWPLDKEPTLKRVFTAGLNHTTALIGSTRGDLVIKRFDNAGNRNEVQAQRWAAQRNLAPAILFHSEEYAYCVMECAGSDSLSLCVEGTASSKNGVQDTQLKRLATALNTLHSVDTKQDMAAAELAATVGNFNILEWCEVYLPDAGKDALLLHQKLQPILESYKDNGTAQCICHNDLVAANCFASNDRAMFIDWEFAQIHNPWFDLAALIYYLNLEPQQSERLLHYYNPQWQKPVQSEIYYSSQIALLWGDMLWHLARFGETYWRTLKRKHNDLHTLCAQLGVPL